MRAADRGDASEVARLLGEGADQSAPQRKLTPQRLAMRRGHLDALRLLQRAGGDEQQLDRPPACGADTVVMRWYYPSAYWIILAVVPAAAGLIIGAVKGSGSAVVAGLILSAVGAVLAGLVVGLNGLERLAFDGPLFWYRAFKNWQGPIDLRCLRAVYFVPASSGGQLYMLQDDAGVTIKARTSHGFDAESVAALNAAGTLRSLAVTANTSSLWPGYLAHVARYVLDGPAVIDAKARALLERALAEENAMTTSR